MRNGYWSGGFFSWEIEVFQCVGFIKMEFSPSNHKINKNHVVFSFYIFPLVPSLWWNRGASFPNFSSLFHGIFVRNITINLKCWQYFIKKHKCWKLRGVNLVNWLYFHRLWWHSIWGFDFWITSHIWSSKAELLISMDQ